MATAQSALISFAAGVVLAVATAPVGVSGAVFMLPFQMSVLHVPNPAVTPTNLLFNIVAIPGALARYRTRAPLRSPLSALLLAGTVPGVIAGPLSASSSSLGHGCFALSSPCCCCRSASGFACPTRHETTPTY
ncbi:MAG: sulfite exporter TauE/SafE family protein [Mycobacterium sp.]|nr:sulfite exporter TauE/SafE family protein [Mycobacterium sp.]